MVTLWLIRFAVCIAIVYGAYMVGAWDWALPNRLKRRKKINQIVLTEKDDIINFLKEYAGMTDTEAEEYWEHMPIDDPENAENEAGEWLEDYYIPIGGDNDNRN